MLRTIQQWVKPQHRLSRFYSIEGAWEPKKRVSRPTMDKMRALNAAHPEVYDVVKLSKEFTLSVEAVRRILKSKFIPSAEDAERQEKNRYEAMGQRRKEFKTNHPQEYKKTDAWKREEEKKEKDISSASKWTNDTYLKRNNWQKVSQSADWDEGNRENRSFNRFNDGYNKRSSNRDNGEARSYNNRLDHNNGESRKFNRSGDNGESRSYNRSERSFNNNRFSDDGERRSYQRDDDRPHGSFKNENGDRPHRSFTREDDGRPRRSFNRDDDRPRRSFNREDGYRPRRSFNREDNDRPRRPFDREDGDRPRRPFNNNREDKPHSPFYKEGDRSTRRSDTKDGSFTRDD